MTEKETMKHFIPSDRIQKVHRSIYKILWPKNKNKKISPKPHQLYRYKYSFKRHTEHRGAN